VQVNLPAVSAEGRRSGETRQSTTRYQDFRHLSVVCQTAGFRFRRAKAGLVVERSGRAGHFVPSSEDALLKLNQLSSNWI
jgi:hypothetical protein